jgi:hypothetical protein
VSGWAMWSGLEEDMAATLPNWRVHRELVAARMDKFSAASNRRDP